MSSIDPHVVVDDDAPGPPISVPESEGEGGKLKMIVQLVKKSLGVKDIAAMRLSLPASLLEPIPNLEYWHYLDRPDMFAAINDSDDPFERMLAVVRFAFTKDLKFVHGKVCKPYNSVLGEHFRTHWDVVPAKSPITRVSGTTTAETASVKSAHSSKSAHSGVSSISKTGQSPSTAATSLEAPMSQLSLAQPDGHARVIYITEQVSHHPPVSAYYAACPSRSLELYGIDQIAAKISGTTLRVSPGVYNRGIYVNITGGPGAGEEYNITHPIAAVNGLLRGSFYVTVAESTIVSCTGGNQRFRAIMEYKEESWLGRAHFLMEGVIHTVVEGETQHNEWTKVKHVPQARVVAVFDGSWRNRIRWRRVGVNSYPDTTPSSYSSPSPSHTSLPVPPPAFASAASSRINISAAKEEEYATLIDLAALHVLPKSVRPLEKQLPHESRRLWDSVTTRLLRKEFSDATKEKVAIEQKQRDEAADRKRKGVEFVPRYFEKGLENGHAALTVAGRQAVDEELAEPAHYDLEGGSSPVTLKPTSSAAS
ncbi:hypothetical protein C8F04DRAFT_1105101 [Mycena alexandri]|uniref:Oxysterol-binding protein n=1 Tax=Mycena alexandri TaxID=1745969 RepID=A0AAD6X5P2_9AGAR|nr:hypothetical protein C8F04DRAFT_1160531 [Mycena alexandri]KAJ7033084.1 hypothetical protein C8F04DRAFT_1105101 [Mycena alexandri]